MRARAVQADDRPSPPPPHRQPRAAPPAVHPAEVESELGVPETCRSNP